MSTMNYFIEPDNVNICELGQDLLYIKKNPNLKMQVALKVDV